MVLYQSVNTRFVTYLKYILKGQFTQKTYQKDAYKDGFGFICPALDISFIIYGE